MTTPIVEKGTTQEGINTVVNRLTKLSKAELRGIISHFYEEQMFKTPPSASMIDDVLRKLRVEASMVKSSGIFDGIGDLIDIDVKEYSPKITAVVRGSKTIVIAIAGERDSFVVIHIPATTKSVTVDAVLTILVDTAENAYLQALKNMVKGNYINIPWAHYGVGFTMMEALDNTLPVD